MLSDFALAFVRLRDDRHRATRPPLSVARHPLNDRGAAAHARPQRARRHDARQGQLFPVDGEAPWSALGIRSHLTRQPTSLTLSGARRRRLTVDPGMRVVM
jgi:hypothetical protein